MRLLLVLCALCLLPVVALAGEPGPHERRAKEHAAADRYDLAVEAFAQQYAETGEPHLLLYIAECHRTLYRKLAVENHLREARRYYVLYLEKEPAGERAARARALLSVVEVELRRLEVAARPPPAPVLTPTPVPPSPLAPAPVAPPPEPVARRWWPWLTIGAAVIGGAALTVLLVRSGGGGGVDLPRGDFPMMRF